MTTYKEAYAWIDEAYPFFYTLVLNLGKGVADNAIPTAAVRINPTAVEGWEMAYNPTFFEPLTPAHGGGVFSHEALHGVLGHLQEVRDDARFPRRDALIIAHECIVNDRLVAAGMSLPGTPYYGPETLGVDTTPYSTEEVYALVVEKLEAEEQEAQEDGEASPNEASESSDGQGSGTGGAGSQDSPADGTSSGAGQDTPSSLKEAGVLLCGHSPEGEPGASTPATADQGEAAPATPEEAAEAAAQQEALEDALLEALKQAAQEAQDRHEAQGLPAELRQELGVEDGVAHKKSMAGDGFSLGVEEAAEKFGTTTAFMKLLADINPDILRKRGHAPAKYRTSWAAPRRSTHHLYPKIIIPRLEAKGEPARRGEGKNKPLIVLALDQSSSIPTSLQKRLIALARSVPEDLIEVECCTFSTQAVPFDIHSEHNDIARGGTNFNCVERFARQAAKRHNLDYPKAVVVITDGEAEFNYERPTQDQLDNNWTWLLLTPGDRMMERGIARATVHQVHDYFPQF